MMGNRSTVVGELRGCRSSLQGRRRRGHSEDGWVGDPSYRQKEDPPVGNPCQTIDPIMCIYLQGTECFPNVELFG